MANQTPRPITPERLRATAERIAVRGGYWTHDLLQRRAAGTADTRRCDGRHLDGHLPRTSQARRPYRAGGGAPGGRLTRRWRTRLRDFLANYSFASRRRGTGRGTGRGQGCPRIGPRWPLRNSGPCPGATPPGARPAAWLSALQGRAQRVNQYPT